jgi:hypothetical protein
MDPIAAALVFGGGNNSEIQIFDDSDSNITQYVGMFRSTFGTMEETYVSSDHLYFNPSTGTLHATDYGTTSDINYKKEIVKIDQGLDVVKQLNPVKFKWRSNDRLSYGVIAQEIEHLIPEAVLTNGGIKSVSYNQIIAFLIAAIKEQQEQIDGLKVIIQRLDK